jgi:hypothetical protein
VRRAKMDDQPDRAHAIARWAVAENMVTVVTTAALVFSLYWMGAGFFAICGFLLLVNLNNVTWGS